MRDRDVDRRDRRSGLRQNGRGDAAEPVGDLLVVERVAALANDLQLGEQAFAVDDRVGRERLQLAAVDDRRGLLLGQEGEDRPSERGCVGGEAAADVEPERDQVVAQDPRHVDDLRVVEQPHVDGLVDLLAEPAQVRMRELGQLATRQRGVREAHRLEPGAEAPVAELLEVAEVLQRLAEAVAGRAVQPGDLGHLADAQRRSLVAEELEDRQRTRHGLDAVETGLPAHLRHSSPSSESRRARPFTIRAPVHIVGSVPGDVKVPT